MIGMPTTDERKQMSKKISETMSYPTATCEEVFTMFTNEGYIAAKLNGTGGSDPDISVSTEGSDTLVSAKRSLPAQVPSFMKSFVGESIRVEEDSRWSPADDLGARTAATTLEFVGTPAKVSGTLDLRPAGSGCEVLVNLDVKASVPLVGGKIEGVIADQIARAINKENEIGIDWLSRS
jgi:hypothetical protein